MAILAASAMALKEWAVVCRALELGRQIITLRKGGIHERSGVFQTEQEQFWLYPTYEHQRREEIVAEAWPLLAEVESVAASATGTVRCQLYAQVQYAVELRALEQALALRGLHLWTEEVIRQRFAYKRPGLWLLVLRVYRLEQPHTVAELPRYAGCRSWVTLEQPLPTTGAEPVLDEAAFARRLAEIHRRLA